MGYSKYSRISRYSPILIVITDCRTSPLIKAQVAEAVGVVDFLAWMKEPPGGRERETRRNSEKAKGETKKEANIDVRRLRTN